jgi:hypothetical protein
MIVFILVNIIIETVSVSGNILKAIAICEKMGNIEVVK